MNAPDRLHLINKLSQLPNHDEDLTLEDGVTLVLLASRNADYFAAPHTRISE